MGAKAIKLVSVSLCRSWPLHRREHLSLVECYKTVFGLNGLNFNDYFEHCKSKI